MAANSEPRPRRRFGAWLRYGAALTQEQVAFAVDHYRVAALQPWEVAAARLLKQARPDMTVLAYKCLSSTRSYESGPVFTSGVDFEEAEEAGEHWFAHRADGQTRVEWSTYPGHWQMAVWEPEYRQRWCDNVVDELAESPWDGVLADNDVFDDYYGLQPPLEGDRGMAEIREGLDALVLQAGPQLNDVGKILVPNIAESRREPGRWARHAGFGGGYEEVYLAWAADSYLEPRDAAEQAAQAAGPGLTIMRTASDGTDDHPNVLYGLAAFWVFGGGQGGAYAATAHDGYDVTPYVPQLDWDLGEPTEPARQRGNGWSRTFSDGFAAVNLNSRRRREVSYSVPEGLVDADGAPAPSKVSLKPHTGAVFVRG